jgi:hypothetical protein
MVNYRMLGLIAEPAVVCRGLTSAGLQSGSKEIAGLMFFTFFVYLCGKGRSPAKKAAKEIAFGGARLPSDPTMLAKPLMCLFPRFSLGRNPRRAGFVVRPRTSAPFEDVRHHLSPPNVAAKR